MKKDTKHRSNRSPVAECRLKNYSRKQFTSPKGHQSELLNG